MQKLWLPLLCALGLNACGAPNNSPAEQSTSSASTAVTASGTTATTAQAAQWHILGEFTTPQGFRYLYVQVPSGLDTEALVALAGVIHQQEPDAWLFLLDDGQEIEAVLEANRSGDMSRFPVKWIEQHMQANSSLVLYPEDRSRRWILLPKASRNPDDKIAELPCIDGKGMCRP